MTHSRGRGINEILEREERVHLSLSRHSDDHAGHRATTSQGEITESRRQARSPNTTEWMNGWRKRLFPVSLSVLEGETDTNENHKELIRRVLSDPEPWRCPVIHLLCRISILVLVSLPKGSHHPCLIQRADLRSTSSNKSYVFCDHFESALSHFSRGLSR